MAKRARPQKRPSARYVKLFKIVDGAVRDAFNMHPDYLTDKGKRWNAARQSIVKRVAGDIEGYLKAGGRPQE